MSFAHNFSHFTGKTKTPIKTRNKKVVRVSRQCNRTKSVFHNN